MNSPVGDLLAKLAKLPGYLASPQENPQLAVVSLGILLAAVLVLLALAILLYARMGADGKSERERAQRERAGSRPSARSGLTLRIIMLVLAGVTVVSIFVVIPYSVSKPRFCLACHHTQPAYLSWKDSTHSGIGCLACHKSPGALGSFEVIVQGAGNAAATYLKVPGTGGSARVRSAACLRCHERSMSQTTVSNGTRVRHKDFRTAIPACTSCHAGSGHKQDRISGLDLAPRVTRPSVMERCVSCHNGKRAFSRCSGCHVNDIGHQAHISPDDVPKISLSKRDLCVACHDQEILKIRSEAARRDFVLVERVCTNCHTLDRLKTSGISGSGWLRVLERMRTKGADFDPEETAPLLNYLQVEYP